MNLNIFNKSGGFSYHMRALWNKSRWRPFCDFVEQWLLEWLQDPAVRAKTTLVLVGANAGYTLPLSFVGHFQNVILVEPDPLAAALFQARFAVRVTWTAQDFFGLSDRPPRPEKLNELFRVYAGTAILFCNVLGQIPVILRERGAEASEIERYMQKLAQVLKSQSETVTMASYHDRYSVHVKRPYELIDHLTGELFSFVQDRKEFPWQLTRREQHQIEFVRKAPQSF